jgi:hypothetical protein
MLCCTGTREGVLRCDEKYNVFLYQIQAVSRYLLQDRHSQKREKHAYLCSVLNLRPSFREARLLAGCLLNLLTAMSQITLPSGKSPIDYYWQLIWDDPQFPMAQDRFFAYVDKALVDDVVRGGQMGSFSEEKDPGLLHPGATLSYKQTQFDASYSSLSPTIAIRPITDSRSDDLGKAGPQAVHSIPSCTAEVQATSMGLPMRWLRIWHGVRSIGRTSGTCAVFLHGGKRWGLSTGEFSPRRRGKLVWHNTLGRTQWRGCSLRNNPLSMETRLATS